RRRGRNLKSSGGLAVLTASAPALPWCRTDGSTCRFFGGPAGRSTGLRAARGGGTWGDPPPRDRWAGGPRPVGTRSHTGACKIWLAGRGWPTNPEDAVTLQWPVAVLLHSR